MNVSIEVVGETECTNTLAKMVAISKRCWFTSAKPNPSEQLGQSCTEDHRARGYRRVLCCTVPYSYLQSLSVSVEVRQALCSMS
jgi:hypothetical protein